MVEFEELHLSEGLMHSIKDAKFDVPSEIQHKTIPLTLEGKDVIAGSATGSGKTLAFGACILENCISGKGIQSLILTPTRELAEQVCKSLNLFGKYKRLTIIPVYGGVGIDAQIRGLRRADVVVGTPGRILDHCQRNTINFSKIKILVLDEADRMLDMGFLRDVEQIIKQTPSTRQTLLFSATISPDIINISKHYMKHAVEVSAEVLVDPTKLEQFFYDVDSSNKFSLLVHLLKQEKSDLVLVFCNTKRNADFVAENLNLNGINAQVTHGGLSQNQRTNVLESFDKGRVRVLVCTDVIARGLDIKGVSHVYNYDAAKTSKEYIHRIGRTARAGKEGKAITIIAERDYENFRNILKDYTIKIEQLATPEVERARMRVDRRPSREDFRGRGRFGNQRTPNRESGRRSYGGNRGQNRSGRSRSSGISASHSFRRNNRNSRY